MNLWYFKENYDNVYVIKDFYIKILFFCKLKNKVLFI